MKGFYITVKDRIYTGYEVKHSFNVWFEHVQPGEIKNVLNQVKNLFMKSSKKWYGRISIDILLVGAGYHVQDYKRYTFDLDYKNSQYGIEKRLFLNDCYEVNEREFFETVEKAGAGIRALLKNDIKEVINNNSFMSEIQEKLKTVI